MSSEKLVPNPEEVAAVANLDRSLATSLTWKVAADWSSQLLSWASFLIVVRILSPSDYGIVAMAMVLFTYLRLVGEFGIPQTIVVWRDLTASQLAQLNTIAVLVGAAGFALACLLAYPLAMFFRAPRLVPVVIVACSSLLVLGFRAVPEGLLNKALEFRRLAMFDAVRVVAAAVATLTAALFGLGYWALILGNLFGYVLRSILVVGAHPESFAWPKLRSIRQELIFGWHVLVSMVSFSAYSSLDNVIAGRVLGQAALGVYGLAWTLANVPLEKVATLVTTVVPSYLATVQSEPAALRRYLRTLTEALALTTLPATVGLGLVARDLVPFALGAKWSPMVPVLQVLCIYAAFRSAVALLPKVLTAVGNARFVMWNDLAALVILPIAFYVGSRWGTTGIAWGWVAAYPLVAAALYWKTFKTIGMNVGEYLRGLAPGLHGTFWMIVALEALMRFLPSQYPSWLRLLLEISAGLAAFLATIFLFHRGRAMAFLQMAWSVRRPA